MNSVAYILIVVSSAAGQPAQVSTHSFMDLEACQKAQTFVLENNKGLLANRDVNATCLLTQSPQAPQAPKEKEKK